MSTPSSNDKGLARRLIVTLLITTAAVTAGVALHQQPHAEAVVQAAGAGPVLAGAIAATAAPVVTRREQWRDPWKRPAPLSESAPTSIHETADAVAMRSDPSLPAAADALQGAPASSGEPTATPTF